MEALKTKEEAAKAVQTYAHLIASMAITVSERDKAQAELNKSQIALTNRFQPKINAMAEQAQSLKAQLEQWARDNRKEQFGEEQSLELSHGFLKFRTGNRSIGFLSRWDETKVLKTLLDFPVTSQWREYIRTEYSINKQKILEQTKLGGSLPAARLSEIGLKIVQGESFSIETKPDMVANDCDVIP